MNDHFAALRNQRGHAIDIIRSKGWLRLAGNVRRQFPAAGLHPDGRQMARRDAHSIALRTEQCLVTRAPANTITFGRHAQHREPPGERQQMTIDQARFDLAQQQIQFDARGHFDVHLQVEVAKQERQQEPLTLGNLD